MRWPWGSRRDSELATGHRLHGALPSGRPSGYTALDECNSVICSIATKADKNKRNARLSSLMLTTSTALVPVCLLVAEQFSATGFGAFVFGRLLPGLLALVATVTARWIQIEQPHQRWTLYRRWQRRFEAQRLLFREEASPYDGDADSKSRNRRLARFLAEGQLQLDDEWSTLIPRSKEVGELGDGK